MQEGQSLFGVLVFSIAGLVIMYFMLVIPQKKKEKQLKAMIEALKVGDKVVTIGGIIGKILNIRDDQVTIETAIENCKLDLRKWSIREVIKEEKK